MNTELARQPNPVEQARNLLRAVFKHEQARDPRGSDAGTLERMLGHLHNIEKSVTASMEDHVNASKRLRDFAVKFRTAHSRPEPGDESPGSGTSPRGTSHRTVIRSRR